MMSRRSSECDALLIEADAGFSMTNAKDLGAWKLGCVILTLASSLQAGDFARQIE